LLSNLLTDRAARVAGAQLVEFRVGKDELQPLPYAPAGLRVLQGHFGDGIEQFGRIDPVDGLVPEVCWNVPFERADPFARVSGRAPGLDYTLVIRGRDSSQLCSLTIRVGSALRLGFARFGTLRMFLADRIQTAVQKRSCLFRALPRPLQARAGGLETVAHDPAQAEFAAPAARRRVAQGSGCAVRFDAQEQPVAVKQIDARRLDLPCGKQVPRHLSVPPPFPRNSASLAKCDAAILIPPVLPPFHRPASSGALTRMTACGSRHAGVIVSAPFLNGVWRARSARADGQVVAAIGRPLRGRTPIDTPLVKDILTTASSFAMALVFLEVSVVSGLTGWENLGVAVDETVVWTSRAARA
jgi:hypothetical protein